MTVAAEAARVVGVSVGGVILLYGAWEARKGLKVASKLATWVGFGVLFMFVLGAGVLLGWWDLNVGTIGEHASAAGDVLGGVVSWLMERA